MKALLGAIGDVNRTRRPEHDVVLRVLVVAAVWVAALAVLAGGVAPTSTALGALALLPIGGLVAWRRRNGDNLLLKVGLTIGAVLALRIFFIEMGSAQTLDDTRLPLAGLFLTIQVLHGFDLPQRRDLGFTLASSLMLIALGATGTHAGTFGLLTMVYLALGAAAMVRFQQSATRELAERVATGDVVPGLPRATVLSGDAGPTADGRPRPGDTSTLRLPRIRLRTALPATLAAAVTLAVLPQIDSGSVGQLPFSGLPGTQLLGSAALASPNLEGGGQARPGPGDAPLSFSGSAYFGFAEYVDLRTSGDLPDTPVLRVRSPVGWPLRGMVFDIYDGRGWTRSQVDEPSPTYGLPVAFPDDRPVDRPVTVITQTIEVLTPTPNLVYGAADVRRVWLAGQSATEWDDGTLSTSTPMVEGTVYSVESALPARSPDELRALQGDVPSHVLERWTQLPDSITDRTRALAAELTDGVEGTYARAEAVEAWIGENVQYRLGGPLPPGGVDQVDDFLFERQVGWCEPIASSMVVLLRAAGVPARFVTGFQPGDRNPLSRVWDVQMSDAHAWVEVWVPGEGWTTFDPTGAVSLAGTDGESSIMAVRLAGAAVASIAGLAREMGAARFAGLVLGLAMVAFAAWRLRAWSLRPPAPETPFDTLVRAVADHVPMAPTATPREWVATARLRLPFLGGEDATVVLRHEEARRYASVDEESAQVPDAVAWDAVARLVVRVEARQSGPRDRRPAAWAG